MSKRFFITACIMLLWFWVCGQITEPVREMGKQDSTSELIKQSYLKKGRTQLTVARIILGTGAVGVIIGANADSHVPDEDGYGHLATGVFIMGSIVVGLVSIPFFIAGSNSLRKAASIGLSNQRLIVPGPNSVAKQIPSISLRIRI